MELIIRLSSEEETVTTPTINLEPISLDASEFPILTQYGNPLNIGDNKVTYSDLK